MLRPLKLLVGIIEQEPSSTHDKITELLSQTIPIADGALKQLSTCLYLLLRKDRASAADPAIADLGVRFWNDIRVANILIREGFIQNAMMMERDAIETRVLAEYLYKNQQEVEAWIKAKTKKERMVFAFSELIKHLENGDKWKRMWDIESKYIHPNRRALAAFASSRPFFGYNLYLGGFYAPKRIAQSFGIQLAICINFTECFIDWYKEGLPFPLELSKEIELLEKAYDDQIRKLDERARVEQQGIDSEIEATRLSEKEIKQLWQLLDTLPH